MAYLRSVACLMFLASAAPAFGAGKTTTVTTYVTTVQEERESTRWTLTEWLRIKERMRMMDVWLAMFSDPKKDRFQPELMLSYGATRGDLTYESGGSSQSDGLQSTAGRAQLWLTNLISGTVGWRMLNVDLGAEAYQRETGAFAPETIAATGVPDDLGALDVRKLRTRYYTGNLRIFGRSIQDSSIVLKYGKYESENSIPAANAAPSSDTTNAALDGIVAGAELQLYFLKFLGAEGNYLQFGNAQSVAGDATQRGTYADYQGFVEISLLRLMAGRYQETWTMERDGEEIQTSEKGFVGGVKVQF